MPLGGHRGAKNRTLLWSVYCSQNPIPLKRLTSVIAGVAYVSNSI